MIVSIAAGATPRLTLDPRVEIQTMTGYITNTAKGDVSNFGIEYFSIYAVAFALFIMTLGVTLIGNLIRLKFQEAYE